jgi:hypothetical protein
MSHKNYPEGLGGDPDSLFIRLFIRSDPKTGQPRPSDCHLEVILERFVVEHPGTILRVIDLTVEGRLFHVHHIICSPCVRVYRAGKQLDKWEALKLFQPDRKLKDAMDVRPSKYAFMHRGLDVPKTPPEDWEWEMLEPMVLDSLRASLTRLKVPKGEKQEPPEPPDETEFPKPNQSD